MKNTVFSVQSYHPAYQAAYQHENVGVFHGKLCSDRRKNHGCGQKKQEGTSSAIFGDETAAKCSKLKPVCRLSSQQNRQQRWRQIWTSRLNFFAEIFSPKLNFSPSTKKTTENSFELLIKLMKLFFDFFCLCQKRAILYRVVISYWWFFRLSFRNCISCVNNCEDLLYI